MRKLRVLVLMHAEFVPPDSTEGMSEQDQDQFRMERDVLAALEALGHEVRPLALKDELLPIREAIEEFRPHIAVNLLRFFHDIGLYDAYVVSYLELLKVPYSGSNPRGLMLASDKALSKKLLTYHRIPTPSFTVFPRGRRLRRAAKRRFPLIVKTVSEHASTGISQASIVRDEDALHERVAYLHDKLGHDAMAEQYIDGRELTIGVIGNQQLSTFPIYELTFDNLPSGAEPIATAKVKTSISYQEKIGVKTGPAEDLPEGMADKIARIAKRVYRGLDLSGFARIDLRMDAEDRIYVLEANPNPDLSKGEDFAEGAAQAGWSYPELIQKILQLGVSYRPLWKEE